MPIITLTIRETQIRAIKWDIALSMLTSQRGRVRRVSMKMDAGDRTESEKGTLAYFLEKLAREEIDFEVLW